MRVENHHIRRVLQNKVKCIEKLAVQMKVKCEGEQ